MNSLKEKIINKKVLIVIGLIVAVIIVIKLMSFVSDSIDDEEIMSKSGLKNIYAIASTSAVKGNDVGVKEFLELAQNQSVSFESDNAENCFNITPDHISQNSEYQIFKFKDTAETFIIYDNTIYKIGNNKRERGTTSFALADINKDDKLELFYTYIWKVADRSNSNVSYFDPEDKKEYGVNKNYSGMNVILVKSKEELSLYSATLSKDENFVDFNLNAKKEEDVLVNDNGTIKTMLRIEFEEFFEE